MSSIVTTTNLEQIMNEDTFLPIELIRLISEYEPTYDLLNYKKIKESLYRYEDYNKAFGSNKPESVMKKKYNRFLLKQIYKRYGRYFKEIIILHGCENGVNINVIPDKTVNLVLILGSNRSKEDYCSLIHFILSELLQNEEQDVIDKSDTRYSTCTSQYNIVY